MTYVPSYFRFDYPLSISTNEEIPLFGLSIAGEFITHPFLSHGLLDPVDPETAYGLRLNQARQLEFMNDRLRILADGLASSRCKDIEAAVLVEAERMFAEYQSIAQ